MVKEEHLLKIVSNNPETLPVVLSILVVAWLLYVLIDAHLEKARMEKAKRAKITLQAIHQKVMLQRMEDNRKEAMEKRTKS